MTAKKMFEELGYTCMNSEGVITYRKHIGTCVCEIDFWFDFEEYSSIETLGRLLIDADTHKAITKQLEELGWLNE